MAIARTVAALTATGAIQADGAPSTSAWLQAHTGRSARDAARITRLATDLDDLPATRDALAAGRVSPEAADLIVRAARDGRLGEPAEVEAALLPDATGLSPQELRRQIRIRQQHTDPTALLADEKRQWSKRRLTLTQAGDGMFDLSGRLPAEVGERARTLLDVYDQPDRPDLPDSQRRDAGQRLADAFDQAVTALLDHTDLPARNGQSRPNISVVVDLTTLEVDLTDPDRPGHPVPPDHPMWAGLAGADTAWAGMLSPQAARRICCDANLSRIVTAGPSQVLDVGRATRNWPAPTGRAIRVRDRHCRGPHCRRPIGWTHIHHIRWWQRDLGETNVDNGISLCNHCHRLIHDHGWTLAFDAKTAAATWTSPDRQTTIVTHPRP